MTVNEQYARLYKTAVDEIIESMKSLNGNALYGDGIKKKKDHVELWCKVIAALAPAPTVELDLEAVEAIRRSYSTTRQ